MIAQTMTTIELETVPRETVRRTLCIKKEAGYPGLKSISNWAKNARPMPPRKAGVN